MKLTANLRSLALAGAMALAPMAAIAQTTAQSTPKKTEQTTELSRQYRYRAAIAQRNQQRQQQELTYKKEPLYVKGNVGVGYGSDPFMGQGVAEPKAYGSIGVTNESLSASIEAAGGRTTQNWGVKVGAPIKTSNPNFNMETGVLFRQQLVSKTNDTPGVVLKDELEAADGGCVERQLGTAFWGAYFNPSYKVAKNVNLRANVEAGVAGVTSGISGNGMVNSSDEKIDIVNRPRKAAAAKVGIGADVDVAKNLKIGGDYTYSTYDRNSGFNVKATYNFRTKDIR